VANASPSPVGIIDFTITTSCRGESIFVIRIVRGGAGISDARTVPSHAEALTREMIYRNCSYAETNHNFAAQIFLTNVQSKEESIRHDFELVLKIIFRLKGAR
jgi:hypothetical protein